MQKDEALARAIKALSRELQELVEDGVRLGWTVTFNPSSGIMTLRSPSTHGSPQVLPLPRGARSLNDSVSRQWHMKLRRYGDQSRLNAQDKEMLSPTRPKPVEDVELPKVNNPPDMEAIHEAAERARKAQEAVNALGAGPETQSPYTCSVCGKGFPTVHELGGHARKHHSTSPKGGQPNRVVRRRPCLICGELKKNMGPHYKWHRNRGEILVIKRDGKDVEVTTTPEQQGIVEMSEHKEAPKVPSGKPMEALEALELIFDAASDALGTVKPTELLQRIAQLGRDNEILRQDNTDLRAKLAHIQKMFE